MKHTEVTPSPLEGYRIQLKETRAAMRRLGVRSVSCFNGGLTPEEASFNSEIFRLKTEIHRIESRSK